MQFDSLAAALSMAGHGPYVWGVALVAAFVIAGLLLLPHWRARRWLRRRAGMHSAAGAGLGADPVENDEKYSSGGLGAQPAAGEGGDASGA